VTERAIPRFLVVGHINKPHGTKGEVFVWTLTDHPESVFAPGVVLILGDDKGRVPEGEPTIRIETSRPFRKGLLVRFEGSFTRNHSEELRGFYLLKATEDLGGRDESEFFYHELLDLDVVTVDGTELGRVREVYELLPAHMLEVQGPSRTHMIPLLKEFVVGVDLEAGVITIDPPEGLLDL
jgi:16S rRNA processing protein RimM